MKYAKAVDFDEIAVLVGDFDSVEDPKAAAALETIKFARPKSLEIIEGRDASQRYAGLREVQRIISSKLGSKNDNKNKGPMRLAFVTSNPLLPADYFAPKGGIDPLVVDMNRGIEHSLLDCPGQVHRSRGVLLRPGEVRPARRIPQREAEKEPARGW
jgi:hypothetical protein